MAVEEFISKYGEGGKENLIREHILKNFYAFELMMAPYAVGHLKMSFLLEELGYKLKKDDRFKLYLTNTLEMEELAQTELPGMVSLSEESHSAGKVKKEQPILVILGNPPYFGMSANRGEWINDLLKKGYTRPDGYKDEGYYRLDGKVLGEKNPKWLQDDYVKFIRFAQWKIDQAGEGVLGFITNHSYLDNPTFRGMRQSLLKSFDEIYVLELHGDIWGKKKSPDGSRDENVFDIRKGVAISLFVKYRYKPVEGKEVKTRESEVYHSEIWGLRERKYDWLLKNSIKTIRWQKLSPKSEYYLFIPREEELLESYKKYPKIADVFPTFGVGMTTARDRFVIDRDKNSLLNRIRLFKKSKYSDDELHSFFQINKKKGWSIRKAWNMLQGVSDADLNRFILPVQYRPFDIQWIFYHDSLVWRVVKRVMSHMMEDNLGLITARSNKSNQMDHFYCTKNIMETKCGESTTQSCLFPLYLYPDLEEKDLFTHKKEIRKQPNINYEILSLLPDAYKKGPTTEEIFYYIYAVLYSNIYRSKYVEFLRIDFPRVPFARNHKQFEKMQEYGKRLVELHLLRAKEIDPPIAKFQVNGDNKVEKIKYGQGRVYINNAQHFEGVTPEIWKYQIGGYQVCDKWLKDRKGRILSLDEIRHYCRVVTAIKNTIEIQKEIDNLYPEIEKETIEFKIKDKE